jgi:hypothetical protein
MREEYVGSGGGYQLIALVAADAYAGVEHRRPVETEGGIV